MDFAIAVAIMSLAAASFIGALGYVVVIAVKEGRRER
jgi:hypothetical protein